jgi:hypothetical protein
MRKGWRLFSGAALAAACSAMPVAAHACGASDLGQSRVSAIESARSLVLEDGRRVRLAGFAADGPADVTRAALAGRLLGRTVTLKGDPEPDRYGRFYAFPIISGSETPLQYDLLERGLGLVSGRIDDEACARAMLAREAEARTAGRGVWAKGGRSVHRAENEAAILLDLGRLALVEGRVVSVRESGTTIYVNFSRRWSEDFTVTIAKRRQQDFIRAGVRPQSLAGQQVRVRGIVEERAGPWIEAVRPAQFERIGIQ